jgi:hypothetical protein
MRQRYILGLLLFALIVVTGYGVQLATWSMSQATHTTVIIGMIVMAALVFVWSKVVGYVRKWKKRE